MIECLVRCFCVADLLNENHFLRVSGDGDGSLNSQYQPVLRRFRTVKLPLLDTFCVLHIVVFSGAVWGYFG